MESNKRNIDEFFREELGFKTELPPASVWETLEKRFDTETQPRYKLRVWWFYLLILGLLTTGPIAAFYWSEQSLKTSPSNKDTDGQVTPTTVNSQSAFLRDSDIASESTFLPPPSQLTKNKAEKLSAMSDNTSAKEPAEKMEDNLTVVARSASDHNNSGEKTKNPDLTESDKTQNLKPSSALNAAEKYRQAEKETSLDKGPEEQSSGQSRRSGEDRPKPSVGSGGHKVLYPDKKSYAAPVKTTQLPQKTVAPDDELHRQKKTSEKNTTAGDEKTTATSADEISSASVPDRTSTALPPKKQQNDLAAGSQAIQARPGDEEKATTYSTSLQEEGAIRDSVHTEEKTAGGLKEEQLPDREIPAVEKNKNIWPDMNVGIKIGYDYGFRKYTARKFLAAAFIEIELTKRLQLLIQPALHMAQANRDYRMRTGTYIDTAKTMTTLYNVEYDSTGKPYGYYYAFAQAYDSIIAYTRFQRRFTEFELPVLFKYAVSPRFAVQGGFSLTLGRVPAWSSELDKYGQIVLRDTVLQLLDPNPPAPGSKFSHSGKQAFSTYTDPYPSAVLAPVRWGYSFGFVYTYRERFLLDLMLQQIFSGTAGIRQPEVRSLFTQPYVRLMLGYRLFTPKKK